MKQTNLKIKNLFGKGEKLTFLIGAGCSVDAPSNVPDGNVIKKDLISYFCAESEIENILKIEDLKLEQILEIIYSSLDEDPKIADYFGLFHEPNLQHFFLADCINKGHFVMTTNFDFLIENALIKLNIPLNEILPVITEEDFENYSNPIELFKRGFKAIYKIHSSGKNVITGKDTNSSFIKAIKILGLNKVGKSIFQIEPFKRSLLDNICEGRSLIIMGYSGINDFDIIPTIKAIKNLKKLIWINHTESIQPDNEIIYEIISGKSQSLPKINKDLIAIVEKLHEICHISNINKIYLINANSVNTVKELIQFRANLSSEIKSLSIKDWLKVNIKKLSLFEKISIASRIYYDFGLFSDAMRCSEIMIRLITLAEVDSWKLMAQEAIDKSFIYQRKNPKTLNQRIKGDKTKSQREILTMRSKCLNLIANIYHSKENYSDAMKKFEEILAIHEKLGNLKDVATSLNNIANIYYTKNKYNEALKNYNRALKIYNQLGDLSNKINNYINIGECFFAQNDYPKAIKSYLSALKIARERGSLKGKVVSLNRLGEIMRIQENYSKALKFTMNAIKVNDQLRDLTGKAISIKLIASIKNDQGYYQDAIKFYNRALKIYEKLGDLSMKGECFINIGEIYRIQGKLSEASKQYKEALNLSKKLEDLKGEAICLNCIGNILRLQGNYPEALELCLSALKINEEGNNLSARANCLKNIALINHDQGNYPEALKFYRDSLLIYKNYKLPEKSEINNIKKKIEAISRLIQKKYILKKKEIIQPDLPEVKLEISEKKDIKFQLNSSDLTKENNDYKDFEINLKFYEEMLKNAELSGDLYKRLKAINQIGEIYKIRGWYMKAVKVYEEGIEIAGKLEDKSIKFTFVSKIRALYNDFFNTF